MNFLECITNISTFTDLKRTASAYLIDYKKSSQEDLIQDLNKTAPQYFHLHNVKDTLRTIL